MIELKLLDVLGGQFSPSTGRPLGPKLRKEIARIIRFGIREIEWINNLLELF